MKTAKHTIFLGTVIALLGIAWALGAGLPSVTASPAATPGGPVAAPLADEGRQWVAAQSLDIKQPAYDAGFIDQTFGITAGYAGEIHYTADGGKTWPRASNQSMCRYALDIVSKDVLWTVGNYGNVRVSVDQGQTWQARADMPQPSRLVSFVDEQHGWAGTQARLWATADGSKTWTDLTIPDEVAHLVANISLWSPTDGYLFSYKSILYTTNDGGKTWASSAVSLGADRQLDASSRPAVRFVDAAHGMIVLRIKGGDVISLKTADGGKTWKEARIPIDAQPALIYQAYLTHDGATLTLMASSSPIKLYVFSYQ